jgi:membrane associated rhomboid family serine protease
MLPLRDRLPTRTVPFVNYALLAANVVVFIWMQMTIAAAYPNHKLAAEELLTDWGLVPARFVGAPTTETITFFSSMFMHSPGTWLHIGGNMLFLWIFGDNVEDALGHARYAAFYLLSGVAAAAAQVLIDPSSPVPMVGASGAISGVLAAYATLYPRSPILLLNPILPLWLLIGAFFELPAWLVILEYFVVNLFNGVASLGSRTGGVAFFAHLGGFVAGLALVRFFMVGRDRREHERWHTWRPSHRPPPQRRAPAQRPPRARDPWYW